jgi:DNA-binding MarR family transcriptional regulator
MKMKAANLEELITLANQIRGLSALITKIARSDLQDRLRYHQVGITAIEHGVLRRLTQGVQTMADISRLMGVPPPTLVYVIDGLVAKGFVTRGKDTRDRRREPLTLEKKGRILLTRIPDMEANSMLVKSLHRMPGRKRRQLKALLVTFVAGMAEGVVLKGELNLIAGPAHRKSQGKRREKAVSRT